MIISAGTSHQKYNYFLLEWKQTISHSGCGNSLKIYPRGFEVWNWTLLRIFCPFSLSLIHMPIVGKFMCPNSEKNTGERCELFFRANGILSKCCQTLSPNLGVDFVSFSVTARITLTYFFTDCILIKILIGWKKDHRCLICLWNKNVKDYI